MKILISGASGFLGKKYCSELSIEHNVLKLSRNNSDYNFDLVNSIPQFVDKFDLVIHAAGKAHMVASTQNEIDDFFKVNVEGTQNLLNALSKNPPDKFVFISSVSVYGLIKGENINESNILSANDPYGKSKILAEKIVEEWCTKQNVIYTILRLPLLAGSNPPGNLGEMIKAINKGYYFNIKGIIAKKSIVLVDDVVNFTIPASKIGGVFNLTDGYHPNFIELSNIISNQLNKNKILNIPFNIALLIAKIGDFCGNVVPLNSLKLSKMTSTLIFDDSKARISFGWNPKSVLDNFKI